ncbi:MAG TPA: hypothetical protein VKC62_07560 [Gaiellaceae bacterium]|nr:hypothetical protein [Gaiellaceae bacterium]
MVALLAACLVLAGSGGAPLATASQELRVLVVKLDWTTEQPLSDRQIGSVESDTAAFYKTSSFGRLTLAFDQTRWLAVPEKLLSCSTFAQAMGMPSRLRSVATSAGYDLSGYDRVVFVFAAAPCLVSGLYEPDGILVNGTWGDSILIHELGHSFGMGHAGSVSCRYTSSSRFCTSNPYGDDFDVMGQNVDSAYTSEPPGDLGALQKARAGWIEPRYVTRAGVYQLAALGETSRLPQALVIRVKGIEYWIDYREAAGNDASLELDPLGMTKGFEVHSFAGRLLPVAKRPIYPNGPDYLLPREQHDHNTYATPPGSTFTQAGLFSLTALHRTRSTITVRFRWLQ